MHCVMSDKSEGIDYTAAEASDFTGTTLNLQIFFLCKGTQFLDHEDAFPWVESS